MGDRIWDRSPKIEAFERQSPEGPVVCGGSYRDEESNHQRNPFEKNHQRNQMSLCAFTIIINLC
jgi:hypothetical protein